MKLKYIQLNKTFIRYFTLALLTALMTVLANGFLSGSASAKITWYDLQVKISEHAESYCAEVKNLDNAWYDDCMTSYQSPASSAFYGSQESVNRQIQEKCSVPRASWTTTGKSPCGAFAEGGTKAINIIKNNGGRHGGSQGSGGNTGGGGGDSDTGKVPGIKRCKRDDIRNTKECKKAFRDCNRAPRTREATKQCKRDEIKRFKKQGGGNTGGGGGGSGGGGGGGGQTQSRKLTDEGKYTCGTYDNEERNVKTKFDFGCIGTQYARTGQGQKNLGPIQDMVYAFIRFLSIGVGIVLAISVIISGIQYSMSEGSAEVTQKAKARIRSAIMGLAIYIFAFSILQFLVPGGVFRGGMWIDTDTLQLILRYKLWT